MAGAMLVILLTIWRGDQIGMRVLAFSPAPAAQEVSTRAPIRIQFDQAVVSKLNPDVLTLQPATPGNLRIEQDSLIFRVQTALAPDTTYTVTVAAGLRGQKGRSLHRSLTWQFRTGGIRVVFDRVNDQNQEQLMLAPMSLAPGGGVSLAAAPQPLATAPYGIWDFTVNPNDGRIVYTQLNQDGTGDLWTVAPGADQAQRLLACPKAACSDAAFSPDGRLLAFVRRNESSLAPATSSPPRLWLLDMSSGATAQILQDNQKLGFTPRWSADGHWVSYLSPDMGGVGVYNVDDGRSKFFPSKSGEAGVWHPARLVLLISDLVAPGNSQTAAANADQSTEVHLYWVDPLQDGRQDLSHDAYPVEDGAPAWSPDGRWIAFLRKELAGPHTSMGKQIWLMRSDGSDATPLTNDPAFDHGPPVWSPDGRYLLFHKFPLKGPAVTLSAWVMDPHTKQQWQIASPGQRPLWVP